MGGFGTEGIIIKLFDYKYIKYPSIYLHKLTFLTCKTNLKEFATCVLSLPCFNDWNYVSEWPEEVF